MPKRLTTAEAATLLGVSQHTARRMYQDGKLTGIQPRTKILIDPESVEKALGRQERRAKREAARLQAVQPIRRPGKRQRGATGAGGASQR